MYLQDDYSRLLATAQFTNQNCEQQKGVRFFWGRQNIIFGMQITRLQVCRLESYKCKPSPAKKNK